MTHDDLLAKIDDEGEFLVQHFDSKPVVHSALRAVMQLHSPSISSLYAGVLLCSSCVYPFGPSVHYPCPTIRVIEESLL